MRWGLWDVLIYSQLVRLQGTTPARCKRLKCVCVLGVGGSLARPSFVCGTHRRPPYRLQHWNCIQEPPESVHMLLLCSNYRQNLLPEHWQFLFQSSGQSSCCAPQEEPTQRMDWFGGCTGCYPPTIPLLSATSATTFAMAHLSSLWSPEACRDTPVTGMPGLWTSVLQAMLGGLSLQLRAARPLSALMLPWTLHGPITPHWQSPSSKIK